MDSSAVKLINISKKYQLFDSKMDRMRETFHPFKRKYHREFWALNNISLDIPRGSTVGILGLNGSGKSTLLQIISSVLQPTSGEILINGKIAALLELGAGFNRDLTARDNVIMNSTIMGLKKSEILKRMHTIEEFADIGEFFYQPMKIYSSGMFARVAFATAIHVDPDILIIDETLSVGDARFREKCFRKFKYFQESGKTIIYVSHDRYSITRLCDLGILLDEGKLIEIGEPRQISDKYDELLATKNNKDKKDPEKCKETERHDETNGININSTKEIDGKIVAFLNRTSNTDNCLNNPTYNKYEHRFGNNGANIIDFMIYDGNKINPTTINSGTLIKFYVKVLFLKDIENPIIGIHFTNPEGILIYAVNSAMLDVLIRPVKNGDICNYLYELKVDLGMGDWFIDMAVAESTIELCDVRTSLAYLQVSDTKKYNGLVRFHTTFTAF